MPFIYDVYQFEGDWGIELCATVYLLFSKYLNFKIILFTKHNFDYLKISNEYDLASDPPICWTLKINDHKALNIKIAI